MFKKYITDKLYTLSGNRFILWKGMSGEATERLSEQSYPGWPVYTIQIYFRSLRLGFGKKVKAFY